MKKIIAGIAASAMLISAFTSCGSKDKSEPDHVEVTEPASVGEAAVDLEGVQLEDNIAAASGDAFISIIDKQNWIKYFGEQWNEKEDKNQQQIQTVSDLQQRVTPMTSILLWDSSLWRFR